MTTFIKRTSRKTQTSHSYCIALKTSKTLKKLGKKRKIIDEKEEIAKNITFGTQNFKNSSLRLELISFRPHLRLS